MKNLRHSRKALSPVVASIILIAVTVAVSIAVAAWMGALTTGFMATEELKITNADFTQDEVTLYVKNTGTASVTIEAAYINGQPADIDITVGTSTTPTYTIPANTNATVTLTYSVGFQDGSRYEFRLMTSKGNAFVYTATAPTSTSSGTSSGGD